MKFEMNNNVPQPRITPDAGGVVDLLIDADVPESPPFDGDDGDDEVEMPGDDDDGDGEIELPVGDDDKVELPVNSDGEIDFPE